MSLPFRLAAIAFAIPLLTACDDIQGFKDALQSRSFSVVSEAMSPTLNPGMTVTGDSISPADVQRGDLLIVRAQDGQDYVFRLVGLPGDTVAVQEGTISLNGEAIEQTPAGEFETGRQHGVRRTARAFREQFPGEAQPHRVLDLQNSAQDDFPPVTLPEDRYFLLGDNRDNALDSRFEPQGGALSSGLGLISGSKILRRVDPESIAN